jgi:hypothetical protein
MSAFENFVQIELPKRPYLDTDVAQETVMVRRGPGPRQLAGVTLTEGQVLGLVGGRLVGVTPSGSGGGGGSVRSYVLTVAIGTTLWTMRHNYNSNNVIVQVFDETGTVILPHDIQIIDTNNIALKFYSNQAGVARAIFLD